MANVLVLYVPKISVPKAKQLAWQITISFFLCEGFPKPHFTPQSPSSHPHHNRCPNYRICLQFFKSGKVVNQSGQEVCQPAFLAIIGPKLADGPPILEEKYKMPQIQIPNTTYKIRLYKFANQQWADRAPFWILFKMKKYKRLKNTDTNGKIQL